ncbi:MAG: hypothetical protein GY811_19650, partial [Myxococcales bacterium]|nr:hypothetical protein [Myxococcales bacterium]
MAYVRRVIEGESDLAPLPWISRQLVDLFGKGGLPDWRETAAVINSDVVLSMKILGAVNVRAEEFGSRICFIDSAVSD